MGKKTEKSPAMQDEQELIAKLKHNEEVDVYVTQYAITSGVFSCKARVWIDEKSGSPYASTNTTSKMGLFLPLGKDAFLTEAAARETLVAIYAKRIQSLEKQVSSLRKRQETLDTLPFPKKG